MIAGIRTDHGCSNITMEDAEEIVEEKRKIGRIYIPITMNDGIKFIDISQTRMIPSSRILSYIGGLNNDTIKNKINKALVELFFSESELVEINTKSTPQEKEVIIDIPVKENIETQEEPVLLLTEVNSDNEIGQKINAAISEQESKNKQKVIELHKMVKRREITKSQAAKQLGMTIVNYDMIIKEINKEEKAKKKLNNNRQIIKKLPTGFSLYYKAYKEGKMNVVEIAKKLNKCTNSIYNYITSYEQMQEQNN